MVIRRIRGRDSGRTSNTPNTPPHGQSRPTLHTIPKSPSTYTDNTLKRTINHFFLSETHHYRAPGSTEYLPTGRPGEVAIYQDSLKAGLRFLLHPFLVEFLCTFNLSPGQLVPNALRMLNYYLLVCLRKGIEPSVDVFRLLFEMKHLDRYDCYVVFSHRDRGIPAHDHFKIPNCPTSNSGWKNRYFFVKPIDDEFPFPLEWGIPPFEDFNSTPILTESEIDSLIILRATSPLGRSMNDVLTDDALVCTGIGRPYDMSADKFTEDFLEELARRNSRGQKKRRRDPPSVDRTTPEANPPIEQQEPQPVNASPVVGTTTVEVAEDCQAVVSCLDWEVIEASKNKSPESLERSIMVEERRVLSLRHAAFRKMRDQADKIEQTGRALEEKNHDLLTYRRSLTEKDELLAERDMKILEDTIGRLEGELATKGESAVEAYKCTDEYMTTVGMVGVRGRDMAFRKSRDWLTERFPNMDFSGAPFMPSVDEEDEDEED
ncbi:Uncharacterized protein Adt_48359 [Abeliophyllum distichum]|uniref:Transposase (putative) gypsy type domain-containing protein n=1 Tax=Abeliophyllum distichum TaxID=126358 RepID=A0ABD1NR86_9LAMI